MGFIEGLGAAMTSLGDSQETKRKEQLATQLREAEYMKQQNLARFRQGLEDESWKKRKEFDIENNPAAPTVKDFYEGGQTVQKEWDPKSKTWKEVGRGPRSVASPSTPKGYEYIKPEYDDFGNQLHPGGMYNKDTGKWLEGGAPVSGAPSSGGGSKYKIGDEVMGKDGVPRVLGPDGWSIKRENPAAPAAPAGPPASVTQRGKVIEEEARRKGVPVVRAPNPALSSEFEFGIGGGS